jgi:two-component system chemotaxis response regulator CheY
MGAMSEEHRLLIVDSSQTCHAACRMLLESYTACSVSVISAVDNQEGLKLLRKHPEIKLILLDMSESLDSALAFLQTLRSEPTTRGFPVVLLIAVGQLTHVAQGLLAGAFAYIVKPVTARRLFLHLDVVLGPQNLPAHTVTDG